jgi:hypothetical protein
LREQLHAADPRHLKIGNDGIERLALQSRESFFAVAGGAAPESRRAQDDGKKLAGRSFVVDGKNASDVLVIRRKTGELAFGFRETAFSFSGKSPVGWGHKKRSPRSSLQNPGPGLLDKKTAEVVKRRTF